MNRHRRILVLAALAGILFLYACSLNGVDPGSTVVTHGTMGKRSVIVNGVHFTVPAGTAITVDDSSDQPESELEDGMVVTLRGTFNSDGVTGTAEKVESEDEVQGQVESVFPTAEPAYLVVLSQNVYVDDLTHFGNVSGLSGLVGGDFVEVHGQRDADGNIRATRVEKLSGSPEIEPKGVVSNLDATSFELWGLTVDFSGAVIEPSGATIAEGDLVEVEGVLSGDVLLVREVFFKRTQIEMEGTVTAATATSVTLLGIEVALTDLTEGTASVAQHIQVDAESGDPNWTLTLLGLTADLSGAVQFQDDQDQDLTREAFSTAVEPASGDIRGTLVQLVGSYAAGVLTVSEAELEDYSIETQ